MTGLGAEDRKIVYSNRLFFIGVKFPLIGVTIILNKPPVKQTTCFPSSLFPPCLKLNTNPVTIYSGHYSYLGKYVTVIRKNMITGSKRTLFR